MINKKYITMKKDYYNILGISEEEKKLPFNEFKKILKQKYRDECKIWHPDKCKDETKKTEYENKFKDISEAYSVLSNEEKKNEYDNAANFQFNWDFNSANGFNDIDDYLKDIFGFGQRTVNRGRSLRLNFILTLEDAYNDTKKTVELNVLRPCKECNGTGKTSSSEEVMCDKCGGTGKLFSQKNGWQTITTCHHCQGKGKIIKNPCPHCKGEGLSLQKERIEFTIPKGVDNDYEFTIPNKGHSVKNGENGNIIIHINIEHNEKFERIRENLITRLKVPVITALLGGEVFQETVDGKKLKIKIAPLTKNNTHLCLKGKGMPLFGTDKYGDMNCLVDIILPEQLNEEEKELLLKLKEQENFK